MVEEKPKLLVVDDETEQCESIEDYFSRRNFIVLSCRDGEVALDLIKENKPDLVLLDLKLEGNLSGQDVLRILRKTDKNTKIAIVTGDVLTDEDVESVNKLGIVDFLYKPVNIHTLEEVIKKVIENKYPKAIRIDAAKIKVAASDTSLRHIAHELLNITSDISVKCELYIINEEDGLNKGKSEKERLKEALDTLKAVLSQASRLTGSLKKLSALAKKEL